MFVGLSWRASDRRDVVVVTAPQCGQTARPCRNADAAAGPWPPRLGRRRPASPGPAAAGPPSRRASRPAPARHTAVALLPAAIVLRV